MQLISRIKNIGFECLRWCFFENTFSIKRQASSGIYKCIPNNSVIPLMQGYYMLELTTSADFPVCILELYVDDLKVFLPITGEGCFKRICYFNYPSKNMECFLDVDNKYIEGLNLSFTKLSLSLATKKIERKLFVKLGVKPESISLPKTDQYLRYSNLFSGNRSSKSYQTWIDDFEPLLWAGSKDKNDAAFKFSIIVPTYNAKTQWLDNCFQSVLDQTYNNWQLVVVDDASTNKHSLDCLKKWQALNDPRITFIYRENNGHICTATNNGLKQASGDFVCFLDHDDTLAPQALNELMFSINENPNAQVLYSDEDLMSEAGQRIKPHFKPDFNPELLLAHNYITHFCCYKTNVINRLGGMRNGLDGAQDYDLILRASRIVKSENIVHIPKVLYHWRMAEGSTAMVSGAKPYATQAGLSALTDHMSIVDCNAKVECSGRENFYKVTWPEFGKNKAQPKVSVIVPTRDGLEVLKPCIDGLLTKTNYGNLEIIIVDNCSVEPKTLSYFEHINKHPHITIIRDDGPFNYPYINNLGVSHSDGELVCLLNNDIEIIHDDWLTEMVSLAIRPEVGCVGAKLLYPDNSIQHAGVILGLGGYAAHSHRGADRNAPGYFCRVQVRQNLSAVTAACLVVKREIYDLVGGLDEAFKVAYNDVDFCLRVQDKGYKNIYTPYAELYHHESKTRGSDNTTQNKKRFDSEKALLLDRWPEIIKHDPAYNPNLTRAREDFSL